MINVSWTPPEPKNRVSRDREEKLNDQKMKTSLINGQRAYVFEHPQVYGRTCTVCGGRIATLADLELDHLDAHTEGGKKLGLMHKDCALKKATKRLRRAKKLAD